MADIFYLIKIVLVDINVIEYCITPFKNEEEALTALTHTEAFPENASFPKYKNPKSLKLKRSVVYGNKTLLKGGLIGSKPIRYDFSYVEKGGYNKCLTPLTIDQLKEKILEYEENIKDEK